MRAKEGTVTMLELGFQDKNHLRSGFRAREISPDSVISTVDPSFSLFSSASGSVDRCSFASDVHDHDSLASEVSQHLAGHDVHETSSGPDSDPNKSTVQWNSRSSRKVEKAKVPKEDNYADIVDSNETLDSARSSFSQALRECKDQRSRSEALLRRADKRRQASLDLNNPTSNTTNFSPRLGVMKKTSVLNRSNGSFPSPGTPNYRHASVGIQKGWSSERVPPPTSGNRRQAGAALLPFNNGRTLPSKWEDAERWIFSPVGDSSARQSSQQQPQRRPKAKSGPLGPPGVAYYSMYSPAVTMFDGGNIGSLMSGSPFSAGVIAADRMSVRSSMDRVGIYPARTEACMGRSVSVHGCSEMRSQLSLPAPQEKYDGDSDAATNISRVVSRRDMATQMSPEGSPYSSPERRLSFSPSPSALPIVEVDSFRSSKPEIRDVQVDGRVTMTRWSKKHKARLPGKGSGIVDDWKMQSVEGQSCAWQVSEAGKGISRVKREEAKITAWENLQQAKAEASIRKLEMKLEKKRSSSMDKIIKKLRFAQKKAQEMRSSVLANQSHGVARTSGKLVSFRRPRQINSLSGCFTCHAS